MSNTELIIMAVAVFTSVVGWCNFFIMKWKWEILTKLIRGMELDKKHEFLGHTLKRLER